MLATFSLLAGCDQVPPELIWSHRTERPLQALWADSDMEALVVAGNVVIFCGGYAWDRASALTALSLADGKLQWEPNTGRCTDTPLVVDSTVIGIGTQVDYTSLKAVDIASGRLRWEYQLPRHYAELLRTHSGWLYFVGKDTLLRVAVSDGRTEQVGIPGCGVVARKGGWVAMNAQRALLACGDSVYTLPTSSPLSPEFLVQLSSAPRAPMTLDGNTLYATQEAVPRAARRVTLAAHDLTDGRLRWRTKLRTFYAPLRVGNKLYATDHDSVVLLDPKSGRILHRWVAKRKVVGTSVLAGDILLYGDLHGVVYAVRAR